MRGTRLDRGCGRARACRTGGDRAGASGRLHVHAGRGGASRSATGRRGAAMFMQREADTPGSFSASCGHEPLMGSRGMNAAIAVHKRYVYVGSRTDGKNNNANHAGVFIVDAQDPTHPFITKRDGPAVRGPRRASPRASCACGARRTS